MMKTSGNDEAPISHNAPDIQDKVLKLVLSEKGPALDAGAGSGYYAYLLSKHGYDVTACDIEPTQFCASGIHCDRVDLNLKLPYGEDSFNIVVAVEVIEHLENPWNFIRETNRVLRPSGVLIFTTPNIESWWSRLIYFFTGIYPSFRIQSYRGVRHISPIHSWTIERMMEEIPFEIEKTTFNRGAFPSFTDDHICDRWRAPIMRRLPKIPIWGEVRIVKLRNIKKQSNTG